MIQNEDFFDWIIKALLAAAFASWAWVVRHFGMEHSASMKRIADVMDKQGDRLSSVEKGLARMEGKLSASHRTEEE